jgi:hypothetical protein
MAEKGKMCQLKGLMLRQRERSAGFANQPSHTAPKCIEK